MAGKGRAFHFERTELEQPCVKDCPGRKAGCAINCEKWAEYLKRREKLYEERLRRMENNHQTENTVKSQERSLYRRKAYKNFKK